MEKSRQWNILQVSFKYNDLYLLVNFYPATFNPTACLSIINSPDIKDLHCIKRMAKMGTVLF